MREGKISVSRYSTSDFKELQSDTKINANATKQQSKMYVKCDEITVPGPFPGSCCTWNG